MGKRPKIGIVYDYSPGWMGGVYYIQNLISALNTLPDEQQPIIYIFGNDNERFEELKVITKYRFLEYRNLRTKRNKFQFYFLLLLYKLFHEQHVMLDGLNLHCSGIKFLYPSNIDMVRPKNKILGWIPDFQEKHLTNMFTEDDIKRRDINHLKFVENRLPLVFSSADAKNDFDRFYPEHKSKTFILRFAVTHPDFSHIDVNDIKKKYAIRGDYLFCANQFWIHKNHLFLFEALKKAKDKGLKLQLVCSGCIQDYRDGSYGDKIKTFITNNKLDNDIIITGFIEREEQLALMKHSYAVVQPSLFEGWSTVVEDAKALNKFIFLSDLNVHREQAPVNAEYFNPCIVDDLVAKLLNTTITTIKMDYYRNLVIFAEDFMRIVNNHRR